MTDLDNPLDTRSMTTLRFGRGPRPRVLAILIVVLLAPWPRLSAHHDGGSVAAAAAETFAVTSRDGERRYEVRIVVPPQSPPAGGYPVLYLLDGRSTLAAITTEIRDAAWAQSPIVFVAIAHDLDDGARLTAARTRDFTVGQRGSDARPSDPPSGGADGFLDLLAEEIRPRVEQIVRVDPSRQAIYGHSYGAMCVLHALFTRPAMFQTYVAASPSLWWGDGYLERAVAGSAPTPERARARVLLTIGDQEARRPRGGQSDPGAAARNVAALESIARQLDHWPAIDIESRVYAGRNHGTAMPPSVAAAVALMTSR